MFVSCKLMTVCKAQTLCDSNKSLFIANENSLRKIEKAYLTKLPFEEKHFSACRLIGDKLCK